ncbi:16S rRNA (uracil(1498)-N(3))-methyltransferase [Nodosilinea sp. P-1105]|uniref:16S rRNA (uracil(1498)-N(3))-methyltransferase n=1 Tax=Nodosilinea sp. P-1105 TaxID=2546229 RepID=UPI00146F4CE7|nr:16S rRNA (uracil(1498)-N(3))-methyltransferase [Nodosilinea sp. P-1105]
MALPRVIVAPDQVTPDQIALTQDQQHYLHRVLRLVTGDRFIALDGQGQQWVAQLTTTPDTAAIVNTQPPLQPSTAPITLVMALPKGNGFDQVVRQATELGVTTIQPVISDRTLHHPNPKKLDRWRRIAAEATEQSERLQLPQVLPPLPWADYLHQPGEGYRWLCVARCGEPHLLTALQNCHKPLPITLAIGPEGGWTAAEIDTAIAAGLQPVSLGPRILRAVTAPLAALALITAVQDLSADFAAARLRTYSQ